MSLDKNKINVTENVICDMAFGSGSLTSHIVLDNFKRFLKLIF